MGQAKMFMASFAFPNSCLSLSLPSTMESSRAIKINILSLFGSLKSAHHSFHLLHRICFSLSYLGLFVKDSMVSVVRFQRALLHMMVVEQVVVLEATDLQVEGENRMKN